MGFTRLFVLLLVTSIISSVCCHHHHHGYHAESKKGKVLHARRLESGEEDVNAVPPVEVTEKSRRNPKVEDGKASPPFSARRLEKMLEKAILKIITGDLSTADMLLLKSLNYSLEEVLAIRERELSRKKDEEFRKEESLKSWTKMLYGEGVTKKKGKHWLENSMETGYSSPPSSDFEDAKTEAKKDRRKEGSVYDKDFDFDAYNRQAVIDYENLASKLELQQSWSESVGFDYDESERSSREKESTENFHRSFDKAMEPHVVFKIRYDDSEFDSSSGSSEAGKNPSRTKHRASSTTRVTTFGSSLNGSSFHGSPASVPSSASSVPMHTAVPMVYQLVPSRGRIHPQDHAYPSTSTETEYRTSTVEPPAVKQEPSPASPTEEENALRGLDEDARELPETAATRRKTSEYEGLEWVEDDVYRVIPAFADSLGFENNEENDTSEYVDEAVDYDRRAFDTHPEGNEKDTLEYQNDAAETVKLFMANTNVSVGNLSLTNLSAYQQLAIAHRRDQGQKVIEDIKSRVLAVTGRLNLSANTNQIQRGWLTKFSPTCQMPRNTDPDAWTDPFSMNMQFQLNLTSGEHVVTAKLRIYRLPQENLTASAAGTFEEDEEDEKKIRISIYYYTKSLKKHRSKKRLMDSVVTPLTSDGAHLALDVRQALRFWLPNPRNPHGNGSNHGLVIQVEDQDGRPLKPALYIQQPSCTEHDSDQKTSAILHSSSEPVLVTFAS